VKLFKAGVSPRLGRHEARSTRAAFAAGAPAPQVFGEVTVQGRFGIVLSRFDGPTLLQQMLAGTISYEQVGGILATLYTALHKAPPPPGLVSLRDWMDGASRVSGDVLPDDVALGVLALIDRLPPGDQLCHADLHPGNVIMTPHGPRIIDWACAFRAPGIIDIGRCHVALSELVPEDDDPEPARAINAAVQSGYAQLAGMSREELTAGMEPYLPVLRALVLLQRRPASAAQRQRLIQHIAAALLGEVKLCSGSASRTGPPRVENGLCEPL
jgi:Ser/Thr protein kinase RdoA (MazF antagonist)